ncbi:M56 family metallopeptidase [Sphingorhabdus sp. EL138]|uniref:M56 family metallopeptidase n=1 Tax=Sphingorhabdus sp. EL138 TaxID=2073156 RepID=UPI000D688438|nr:M56 family metallopeptidase [Sphingorhabdus sp. EL138]
MTNWMMDTMVSMTLLMALVLIIRKPVSQFFGPHIAYLLWALPLARLFMPTLTLKAPAPVETGEAAVVGPLLSEIAMVAPAETAAVGTLASIDWMMIALVVWLGGAGMLFISKLAAYFQFREDIVSDGRLVGRHGRIKILETAAVGGPLAFGLFEKYIAVPTNFFRDYAPRERELALEHEIAHHESGDLAANFIGLVILSLHWFNPVAWLAWIAFRQDQETACDARILQNGGRNLRAVYGRTIAKSVSGHKLGLASPLNQKNKIKDRLKMLGQKEKSKFRKRAGALLVGAGTVIALPLTATVTYAVETEVSPHDELIDSEKLAVDEGSKRTGIKISTNAIGVDANSDSAVVTEKTADGYKYIVENEEGRVEFQSKSKLTDRQIANKLRKISASKKKTETSWAPKAPVPPVRPVPPAAPSDLEFTAWEKSNGTINITMLNGEKDWAKVRASGNEHVHKIKYNGRTVVLRTNKPLTKQEIKEMVREAEESRREAEEAAREARLDREEMQRELAEAARELREAEREWKREWEQERKEASQMEREAQRDVERSLREAQREVRQAQREAARELREAEREAREAEREAEQEVREAKSVATRIWDVTQIAFKPNFRSAASSSSRSRGSYSASGSNADCAAMNKKIAFAGQGVMNDQAWASVVGCSDKSRKITLQVALKKLEKKRAKAAECSSKDSRQKLKAFDRDIKDLKAQLSVT